MDPGSSSSQVQPNFHEPTSHEKQDMQYDEAFPALPPNPSGPNSGQQSGLSSPGNSSKWSQKMRIGSNIVTSVFNIPFEERSDRSHGDRFGELDALKACAEITKQTDAHIEMSSSARDHSLTFLVTGKQSSVLAAKREILARFQTQAQVQISIPKEHHRFLLGSKGALLAELERTTATKISIPRPNEDSSTVTVTGTREGIEKAVHEIRLTSDKQSKQASETVNIPKKYHAFICGPYNDKVKQLETEYNVKVNIPPPSVMKDDIHISGEKEGVARVVAIINKDHNEYKRYNAVSVEVGKAQHKYVIGPKRNTIYEILAKTGVSVELPPSDSTSETITIRGPAEALGNALTMVYEKANSVLTRVIEAPDWIHKYIVGKKGANIRNITANYPKAHVEIKDNQIVIEGPGEEVIPITTELENCVADLLNNKCFKEIQVDPKYHKHIIGKAGSNVNRLRDETGVIISVKDVNSSTIHLEGSKAGVELAAERLLDQVGKLENEKEKDLIIEHRFHGNLIGSKGEKIREIRDKFNQVQVNFPPPGEKRDVVTIRGPKDDVDKCGRYLTQLYKDMLENSYQTKVSIFPQTYRVVVGKGNVNIKNIREEFNVRMDLPPYDDKKSKTEAEVITITGRKENCEKAKDKITNMQSQLGEFVEVAVMIPSKFHNTLIGAGGKMVQSISEDCGGVQITFPDAKLKSDKVTILGPKENVEKAKLILLDTYREREQNSYTETIEASYNVHKFLVGKNNSNIRRIRESTGVRVIFPFENDVNPNLITLIGKKENVLDAKTQLTEMLKDLEKVTEAEMDVDPQFHRHFVIKRGEILRQISDELGGVSISFPKMGSNSTRVVLKGSPECVEAAKKRIASIVDDLEQRITVDVVIEQKHHRTIMGTKGSKVQQIQMDHNVDIKFPERRGDSEQHTPEENGDGPRASDIITVSGRPENCESAKEALLEQVPVSVEVDVPFDVHRFIIGTKGKDVRDLMHTYDVHITVPPQEQQSDTIVILGSPKNAAAAKEALLGKAAEFEEERKQKELKSYSVRVKVDKEFHPKIIGRRGAVINEIRTKHDVYIQLPSKDVDDDEADIIIITGFEEQANAARDEILSIVNQFNEMIREEVEIDHRVHSRIIGSKGKNIRQVMQDFKVDIRFPRQGDANLNLVVISGNDADLVYDAKDHLQNLEEEYMQDVKENEYMQQFVRDPKQDSKKQTNGKQSNGFVVQGAPWEKAPDTQSNEEFPSMGNGVGVSGGGGGARPLSSAWGARKHF